MGISGDIAMARKRLEVMLIDLDRSIEVLHGGRPSDNCEDVYSGAHPADSGSHLSDAERGEALLDAARRQREQVVAAIRRVEDGTYGACAACGKPVPDGRLEARPEAARCVPCQSKLERR